MVPGESGGGVLEQADPPFAPVSEPVTPPAPIPLPRRAMLWSQYRRLPITLVFAVSIASAAFFAYRSGRDGPVGAGETVSGPRADSLTAAVDDLAAPSSDLDRSRSPAGAETVAAEPDGRRGSSASSSASNRVRDPSSGAGTGAPPTTTHPSSAALGSTLPSGAVPSSTVLSSTVASPTVPSSTAPPSTVPTSTPTTVPSTSTTAGPPRPVFIGDRITLDDWDGPGFGGLTVTLLSDDDGDGVGSAAVASDASDAEGRYGFTVDPGCYVVSFAVPADLEVLLGGVNQPMCLGSGESEARADLVLATPTVQPPPACDVQLGDNAYAGVEIRDSDRNWAPSYAFYDAAGGLVLRTADLGPPDDTTNPDGNQIEWTSEFYDYDESVVHAVAAEDRYGFRSVPVTCSRRNV